MLQCCTLGPWGNNYLQEILHCAQLPKLIEDHHVFHSQCKNKREQKQMAAKYESQTGAAQANFISSAAAD